MSEKTRRQQKQEETAQRLFEAAVRLFETRGYEATTVEAITEAAGVAKGTFFNYFAGKDAVLGYLGQAQMRRLTQSVEANADFAQSHLRDQLRFITHTLAAGVEQHRKLTRAVAGEMLRHSRGLALHQRQADQFEELLGRVLQSASERGDLRAEIDIPTAAGLLRDAYFMALLRWLNQDEGNLANLLDTYFDLLLQGIAER